MTPALHLRPHGRLGNHVMQWMTAESLAARVPGLRLRNFDLGPLGRAAPGGKPPLAALMPSLFAQDSDLDLVAQLMTGGEMPFARLYCIVMQAAQWGEPERFRRLLPMGPEPVQTAGPGEILLNVRADEILKARHRDYGPLPLGFYAGVLRETGLRPVFMGQLGEDDYSRLLRQSFPEARFLPSQGALGDFNALRQARHVALSVSTFSWAAGWLSQAESVHMPLLGFFNPEQRPDIDLCPTCDTRFHFYRLGLRQWTASAQQVAALSDTAPVPRLSAAEVEGLRQAAKSARAAARKADAERIVLRARRLRPALPLLRRLWSGE